MGLLSKFSEPLQQRERGGWRQRLQRRLIAERQRAGRPLPTTSYNAISHLQEWSEGLLSAPRLRRHALGSVRDGTDNPFVVRLSRIGDNNPNVDNNCHRDLMKLFNDTCGLNNLLTKCLEGEISCLMKPTTIFKLLGTNRHWFVRRFCARPARVMTFWANLFHSRRSRLSGVTSAFAR